MSYPFLEWLFQRRESVVISVSKRDTGIFHTGHFDDLVAAVAAVTLHDTDENTRAIYYALNIADPAKVPIHNAITPGLKRGTGKAYQRDLFLIDLDVPDTSAGGVRPEGTGSTEIMLTEAHRASQAIKQALSLMGWPDPIEAMSGNGIHLTFAMEKTVQKERLSAALKELGNRFDVSQIATVDRSVFKQPGLSKLYGTMTRKGNDPSLWRKSGIIHQPTELIRVTSDQIESLIPPPGRPSQNETSRPAALASRMEAGRRSTGPQLENELDAWGLSYHLNEEGEAPGGEPAIMVTFEECPFRKVRHGNGEHSSGGHKAFAFQLVNEDGTRGKLGAGCVTDGCTQWISDNLKTRQSQWNLLRELSDESYTYDPDPTISRNGGGLPGFMDGDEWITYANSLGVFYLETGSKKGAVCRQRPNRALEFYEIPWLENTYPAPRIVINDNGDSINGWKYWMRHPERRSYSEFCFIPSATAEVPDGAFNLWAGFGVDPMLPNGQDPQEYCRRILRHTLEVICDGDLASYDHLIKLLAWMIQCGHKQTKIAVAIRGAMGSGKSIWCDYVGKIFAPHYATIDNPSLLLGDFNYLISNKVMITCEEAFFAKSPTQRDRLKSIITSPKIMVNRKFHDATETENPTTLFLLTNHDHAVPVEIGDRRFFCLNTNDEYADRMRDPEKVDSHFDPLVEEMESTGPSALLSYLQRVDLIGYNPAKFPHNAERKRQIEFTFGTFLSWWQEVLESGSIFLENDSPNRWPTKPFRRMECFGLYQEYEQGDRYPMKKIDWKREMEKYGATFPKDGAGKIIFQSLENHREIFNRVTNLNKDWGSNEDTKLNDGKPIGA